MKASHSNRFDQAEVRPKCEYIPVGMRQTNVSLSVNNDSVDQAKRATTRSLRHPRADCLVSRRKLWDRWRSLELKLFFIIPMRFNQSTCLFLITTCLMKSFLSLIYFTSQSTRAVRMRCSVGRMCLIELFNRGV